ncbi:hypothetical protein A3D03_06085 [Candidatus Gottesmanbacteria bacterium RIFCSPHIGHO2_02_FULL_40_13]|uniref:Zinc finger DksA/TraR C4-type domain-containing protein n=1 Tax=Candidatus Gottesmanbacteria bacterium RIFCSPHIGHO2_02_FULL_40_13 TaxID=1798384 RepID=A0A1F6A6W3_9BACT|nr:MAG: hypothetical protein A3D03_06085 [Candidatus Gottesmanbacteria bacterium RIFCSPHIGHO2_02_FULL_40_13]
MKYPKQILEGIKNYLLTERSNLNQKLLSIKSQDPFSDPERTNDNAASDTEAQEESSHDRLEALEKELQLNLREVNQALERIDKDSYGKCLSCKSFIDTERLAVKPTALYCVSCEAKKNTNEYKNSL